MQYIQWLTELLTAIHKLTEPIRLLTFDVLSYWGFVYALRRLLEKHRL